MSELTLLRAAMIADGDGVTARPGALLLRGREIVDAAAPARIGEPSGAAVQDLRDAVIVPAFVNAHAHLDLTHIGPVPEPDDFATWIALVRAGRRTTDDGIAASVRDGLERARAGGTAAIGDIAGMGSLVPLETMRREGPGGVSYVEIFGQGRRQAAAVDRVRALDGLAGWDRGVRLGVQPHAPYSCGPEVYRAAAGASLPVCTHLAETTEELQFMRSADGPLADLLREIGVWDETIRAAGAAHPVDAIADIFQDTPLLAAHVNYIESAGIERLSRSRITVAYCPRATRYFGHFRGGGTHRYRAMIDAGVRVALGTDSMLCLDTPDRISVLDEMRLLYARDGTDPALLLRMATTAGAEALGFDREAFTLAPGATAGLLALTADEGAADPLRCALQRDEAPRWLLDPAPAERGAAGGGR